MALWSIKPKNQKDSVTEIQTWVKGDNQLIRTEQFNWAEFLTNSDLAPEVDLANSNGYRVNHDLNYSWSLFRLEQTTPTPTVSWQFPSDFTQEQIDSLKIIVDQGYTAIESDGWYLSNTDFWLWGELILDISNDASDI